MATPRLFTLPYKGIYNTKPVYPGLVPPVATSIQLSGRPCLPVRLSSLLLHANQEIQ